MRLSTPRVPARLRHLLLGCCVLTTFAMSSWAQASPPSEIRVQARLQDGLGNELDGVYTLVFRLYEQPTGGVSLASETRDRKSVV